MIVEPDLYIAHVAQGLSLSPLLFLSQQTIGSNPEGRLHLWQVSSTALFSLFYLLSSSSFSF